MSIAESISMYSQGEIDGISPISEGDGMIILKLRELSNKMGLSKEFCKALDLWKEDPDDSILDLLDKLDTSWVNGSEFVMIDENTIVPLRDIFSIKSSYIMNTLGDKTYTIVVNETENERVVNSNIIIKFRDSRERDLHFRDLVERLGNFTSIRFL